LKDGGKFFLEKKTISIIALKLKNVNNIVTPNKTKFAIPDLFSVVLNFQNCAVFLSQNFLVQMFAPLPQQ